MPPPNTHLLSVPNEILLQIIANIADSEPDYIAAPFLHSLALTNRRFFALIAPTLDRGKQYLLDASKFSGKEYTILQEAAKSGNIQLTRRILLVGADPSFPREPRWWRDPPPIVLAYQHNLLHQDAGLEIARLLATHGADLEIPWLIHNAVKDGNLELVRILLDNGADVGSRETTGMTALFYVGGSSQGDKAVKIARLLLDRGADRHSLVKSLFSAVLKSYPNIGVVRLLLANGADVNARDNTGSTVLNRRVQNWNFGQSNANVVEVVRILLEAGADVNASTGAGLPMVLAMFMPGILLWQRDPRRKSVLLPHGWIEVMRLLLQAGASVNSKDRNSAETALHYAMMVGDEEILQMLLQAGANTKTLDNNGRTPAQCRDPARVVYRDMKNYN